MLIWDSHFLLFSMCDYVYNTCLDTPFLPCDAMLVRYPLSEFCPSVCPSHACFMTKRNNLQPTFR